MGIEIGLPQTPPYPHPHLWAMGLLLAFAYYFAQTIPSTVTCDTLYKMSQHVGLVGIM